MKINEDFKHELLDIKSRISNPNPLLVSNILLFKEPVVHLAQINF